MKEFTHSFASLGIILLCRNLQGEQLWAVSTVQNVDELPSLLWSLVDTLYFNALYFNAAHVVRVYGARKRGQRRFGNAEELLRQCRYVKTW